MPQSFNNCLEGEDRGGGNSFSDWTPREKKSTPEA
jgi:hypothetical protein